VSEEQRRLFAGDNMCVVELGEQVQDHGGGPDDRGERREPGRASRQPGRLPASQADHSGGQKGHAGQQQKMSGVPARVAEHGVKLLLEGAALDMLMRV
jgi:hypothetical protein